MDGAASVGDSHEWEEKCKQLLAIRYADELQLIDASRTGDLGLEAFTRQSCLGFQCYAPLEPLSTQERHEKHRDKITRDLGKLEKNQDALMIILGPTRLKRYVFMVPRFDPPLLAHCGSKRDEFRAKGLAILAVDFDIVVQTEENYPLERAQLVEAALAPLGVSIPEIDEEARARWAEANVSLVETLNRKIAKFKLGQVQADELRDEFLKHYLRREQLLDQVFNEAPDTHVRLELRIRQRERLLASARLMSAERPIEHARTVIEQLARELLEESKALQSSAAEAISWGTAADWMIRCPLDFNNA